MDGERVLLVDDEIEFIQTLSERLEARGLTVELAQNGPEALKKVSEGPFDAIVLDLAMPGMDGIETLSLLRKDHPEMQVILLTGHATVEKGVEAIKLGAMDFLEKPVGIQELMEKVKEAREKRQAAVEEKTKQMIADIVRTKGW
ncbi:MAG: response regulator [Acidobacteriota bacterium]